MVPKEPQGESRERLQGREAAPESGGADSGQGSKREVEEAESPPPAKKARPCPARQVSDLYAFLRVVSKSAVGGGCCCLCVAGSLVSPGHLYANRVEFDADPEPEKYRMQKVKEQKWEYPFNKLL